MASERPVGGASVNFGQVSASAPTSTHVLRGGAPLYRELATRIGVESRYSTTPSQIHEWVMAGLLPKTPIESLGWGRGFTATPSEQLFPQLIALCRFREVTDRTDRLRMLLWLEEWQVDSSRVLQDLLVRLEFLPRRKPSEPHGMDRFSRGVQRVAPDFVRRLGIRGLKGSSAIDGVYAAGLVVFGQVVEVDRWSVELLVRAFGLDRALRDRIGETGPWLTGDLVADLRRFARMRPLTTLYDRVAVFTPDELDEIRPYARFVTLDLPLFGRALEVRFGANAFGFGGLRIVTERPELGIAVAAFFSRSRLRPQLDRLTRRFAENREQTLAIVEEADRAG